MANFTSGKTVEQDKNVIYVVECMLTHLFPTADNYTLGKLRLAGLIGNIPIPFPVRPDVACDNWGLSCPLLQENRYSMQLQLLIRRAYPRIPLEVKMQLVSENSKKIICTKFPARIQTADPSEMTKAEAQNRLSKG